MAKQTNDSRRVSPGHNSSTGTAVLDRPSPHAPKSQKKDLLNEEILRLASALQQGRLAQRAKADLFEGGDRTIMESLNGMSPPRGAGESRPFRGRRPYHHGEPQWDAGFSNQAIERLR